MFKKWIKTYKNILDNEIRSAAIVVMMIACLIVFVSFFLSGHINIPHNVVTDNQRIDTVNALNN